MDFLCTDVHLLDIYEENINDENDKKHIHNDTLTHTHSAIAAAGIAVYDVQTTNVMNAILFSETTHSEVP